MTDTTRPLHPPFAAILAALAEQGESTAKGLGPAFTTPQHLAKLIELGYVTARRDLTAHRLRNIYCVTDLGREVLAAGTVPYLGRGPKAVAHPRFTATAPPRKETVARVGCVHHFEISSDRAQIGICKKCGKQKSFAPTFARDLAIVGGGRVTASERFAARVGA